MRYCKLQNNDRIYTIENISNDVVKLRYNNAVVVTNISNIIFIEKNDFKPNVSRSYITLSTENIPNEIMLRHKSKEEAISLLDKYIDQAFSLKLGRIKIIHGKQGGILRESVHKYLKTHPLIKEFYIADYHEGGLGVTIAILGKKKQ